MAEELKPIEELDWLKLQEEMATIHKTETFGDRFKRKILAQPLIPVGCLGTVGALSYGLWCFRCGNSRWSQYMMRTRVVAQGFTIAVAVFGTLAASKHSASTAKLDEKINET